MVPGHKPFLATLKCLLISSERGREIMKKRMAIAFSACQKSGGFPDWGILLRGTITLVVISQISMLYNKALSIRESNKKNEPGIKDIED